MCFSGFAKWSIGKMAVIWQVPMKWNQPMKWKHFIVSLSIIYMSSHCSICWLNTKYLQFSPLPTQLKVLTNYNLGPIYLPSTWQNIRHHSITYGVLNFTLHFTKEWDLKYTFLRIPLCRTTNKDKILLYISVRKKKLQKGCWLMQQIHTKNTCYQGTFPLSTSDRWTPHSPHCQDSGLSSKQCPVRFLLAGYY